MVLTKGSAGFHSLMKSLRVGDTLTRAKLMKATGWSDSTLRTYLNKNKLLRFLRVADDGENFLVLRAGPKLAELEVERALTQVSDAVVTLTRGDELESESGRRYQLIRPLGQGAMGHVWEASNDQLGSVAIKVLIPRADLVEPTRMKTITARFRREVKNGAKLRHPNIIKHLDHGDFGSPFLVMELADRSWDDVLSTSGPVDRRTCIDIIRGTAAGLSYLHGLGCVHRDIKPANLLVCDRGTIIGDLADRLPERAVRRAVRRTLPRAQAGPTLVHVLRLRDHVHREADRRGSRVQVLEADCLGQAEDRYGLPLPLSLRDDPLLREGEAAACKPVDPGHSRRAASAQRLPDRETGRGLRDVGRTEQFAR